MANGDQVKGPAIGTGSGHFQRVFTLLAAQEAAEASPPWVDVGPHEEAFIVVDAADANNVCALDGGASVDGDDPDTAVQLGTINSNATKLKPAERWPQYRARKTGVGTTAMTVLLVVTYRR